LSEKIRVIASGKDYPELLANAIEVADRLIGDAGAIHRNEAECKEMVDWYVWDVDANPSPGGQSLSGEVEFVLSGSM
jgi:hypothetical protein